MCPIYMCPIYMCPGDDYPDPRDKMRSRKIAFVKCSYIIKDDEIIKGDEMGKQEGDSYPDPRKALVGM